jgi:hypothetical protein
LTLYITLLAFIAKNWGTDSFSIITITPPTRILQYGIHAFFAGQLNTGLIAIASEHVR